MIRPARGVSSSAERCSRPLGLGAREATPGDCATKGEAKEDDRRWESRGDEQTNTREQQRMRHPRRIRIRSNSFFTRASLMRFIGPSGTIFCILKCDVYA